MELNEQAPNRMLRCLSEADYVRLASRLENVSIPRGTVVCNPGQPLEYAYFPIGCVLSSVIQLENGATVEATTIGNDGMVDVGLAVNRSTTPYLIIQQVSGDCLRMRADLLYDSLEELPRLRWMIHRYCLTLLHQSSQNSACNVQHSVEARLARWLLVCSDRCNRSEMDLTQEFLATMLGVRRQSVNLTVGLLQRAGLISFRRGAVRIVNRAGLEATACECYRVSARMYDRNMS